MKGYVEKKYVVKLHLIREGLRTHTVRKNVVDVIDVSRLIR